MKIWRTRLRFMAALGLLFLALLITACGGGDQGTAPQSVANFTPQPVATNTPQPSATPASAVTQSIEPIIVSSELSVGPNRFLIGLADEERRTLVIGAQLHFRLFKLGDDGRPVALKAEMDARSITVEKNYTHVHRDGTAETHGAGIIGVYVANVEFDQPGAWGVEITGTFNGQPLPTLTPGFEVQEESLSVPIGRPAPRTVQTILKDVKDISEIDTSNPPDPHMHTLTIADAVTSGRPTVIVFSTPGFCMTRICGPTKDVVDQLYEKYKGQANFIHVEPYDLEKVQSGQGLIPVPAMAEWGMETEPWVFLIDREGKVGAKFEGITSFEEVEEAFTPLLTSSSRY